MKGILCIDKPSGYTSFDVVARIRGMAKTRKVGHSGTLDPMATGVLPIFIGSAAKACDLLPDGDKRYLARFCLGKTTDTYDSTGTLLSNRKSRVGSEEVLSCLARFRGPVMQLPPMYSAVRVNGKRLYEIARAGGEVERKPRPVTIYELTLSSFDPSTQEGELEIFCSKGTYVRSIVHDLGQALGVGGVMTALRRTQACSFRLADCITLEEAQERAAMGCFEEKLLPVDRLFEVYPPIRLNEVQSARFQNGVKLDLKRLRYQDAGGFHRVYGADGAFLGLASLEKEKEQLKIEKLFL